MGVEVVVLEGARAERLPTASPVMVMVLELVAASLFLVKVSRASGLTCAK